MEPVTSANTAGLLPVTKTEIPTGGCSCESCTATLAIRIPIKKISKYYICTCTRLWLHTWNVPAITAIMLYTHTYTTEPYMCQYSPIVNQMYGFTNMCTLAGGRWSLTSLDLHGLLSDQPPQICIYTACGLLLDKVYLTAPEPLKNCHNLFIMHPIWKALASLESS